VTGGKHGKGKRGTEKYFPDDEWDALSTDAKPAPIESCKEGSLGKSHRPIPSAVKENTIKSISKTTKKLIKLVSALLQYDENKDDVSLTSIVREEGSSHFQGKLGKNEEYHPMTVLALKHRACDRVDTTCVVPCSETALPKLLLDIELFGKQQIARAVRVRELLEEQGYPSTAECGLMLYLEGIPVCKDTPEDVARRELVMQTSPRKTMTDCRLHASDLQFTNWKDQEIGEVTQVLDPGVDESDECVAAYPASEIPGVEVTVGDINED
jgi:hypothetical protein